MARGLGVLSVVTARRRALWAGFSLAVGVLAALCLSLPSPSIAGGGICLLHAQPFTLRSDTVRWSIRIKPGSECIQGLRWSTIMIDNVTIVEPPKSGRLVIEGPAFRYFANADAQGSDSFKIAISGRSLRISGTSSIEVDVTSQ
ncbi:hypothetical protein ACVWZ4_000725 [Bradyrhizobium sp. USDA 4472]